MAAFLHDIGKGWRQGDHSARGASVAETVGRRFAEARLPAWTREETQDLVWLVKEHLTMSAMSQRRDVADRALLDAFADDVRTSERLTMLYLLTFADMRGTSPKVWTDWKGSLLSQLYHNTREVLDTTGDLPLEDHERGRRKRAESELVEQARGFPSEIAGEFTQLAPTRYIMSFQPGKMAQHLRMWLDVSLRGGFAIRVSHKRRDNVTELTIACPDRPRLLALLAGTLAANSLQILSAQIFSIDALPERFRDPGAASPSADYDLIGSAGRWLGRIALDVLYVKDADGRICDDPVRWDRVRDDLKRVFLGEDEVEELIDARVRGSTLGHRHRPEVETKLVIANDASDTETVIDVFCQDHLGALYTISKALSDQGLSISLTKISTEGNRVADGFYVTDAKTGAKIQDAARFEAIREAVKQAVDRRR
jgi:[protein-PII] uridylyltransferase